MRHLFTVTLAAAFCAPAHAQSPNMKEGLWEMVTKMEMAGMPSMPPQTMQRCVTKADLADPTKTTPGAQGDKQCKISDYKLSGNTASWKVACAGESGMTGTGSITYAGTSYNGTQTMSMKVDGKPHNMTMNFSARHLGDCKKP